MTDARLRSFGTSRRVGQGLGVVLREGTRILAGLAPAVVSLSLLDVGTTHVGRLRGTLPGSSLLGIAARDWVFSLAVLLAAAVLAALCLAALRELLRGSSLPGRPSGALAGVLGAAVFAASGLQHFFAARAIEGPARLAGFAALTAAVAFALGAGYRRVRSGSRLAAFAWIAPVVLASLPLWLCATADGPRSRTAPGAAALERLAPEARRRPPEAIILVTLDTTRLDAVGYSGRARARTPALDELAAEGVAYLQATTYMPLTLPSHASILTGELPPRLGLYHNGVRVPTEVPLLAEHLHAAGWRTGAVISARVLDSSYGLARGFEFYEDRMDASFRPTRHLVVVRILYRLGLVSYRYERRAHESSAIALDWLGRDDPRPPFLWIHYFDPHAPHEPRGPLPGCTHAEALETLTPEQKRRYAVGPAPGWFLEHSWELYLSEVEEVDRSLGELVSGLRELGLWDGALLLVLADHGETLGHGYLGHAERLYESTLGVPLILRWPGVVPAGRLRSEPVGIQDVYPTLLEAAGLRPRAGIAGRSLLSGEGRKPRPEKSFHESQGGHERGLAAVRTNSVKLILHGPTGIVELYDLESDPGETRDLSDDPTWATRRRELEGALRGFLAEAPEGPRADRPHDAETLEMLRNLGYLED